MDYETVSLPNYLPLKGSDPFETEPSPSKAHGMFIMIGWFQRLLLILLFAIWWGGLTFYALIVVPIGSDVTSSVVQGFVTQRVTFWHNLLLTLVTFCAFAKALSRHSLRWWLLSASLLFVNAALLLMHWKLSGMIDATELRVPSDFYRMHAFYCG